VYVTPFDATLAINWPIHVDPENRAHVSTKDAAAPSWMSVRESLLR